ncbi:hypothetical protein C8F01DRAFT_753266 [Mycena amicta]|nr:hypothetical protein C8F01DRAFT_753266 [Mycena amicta]
MSRQSEPFDDDIERVLFQLVPWTVRKEGGIPLQDAIRAVWMHGELFGEGVGRKKAAEESARGIRPLPTGQLESAALEAERVWGFDVGYSVAVQKFSESRPAPSPASYAVQSVQTEPPPALPALAPSLPAIVDVAPIVAVHAAAAPTALPPSVVPPIPPRDLSVLSSGTRRPFGSLQWRRCRQRRVIDAARQDIPSTSCFEKGISPSLRVVHPRSSRSSLQVHPSSRPTQPPPRRVSPLDWDHDPRLHDLSRALTALGWKQG